MRAEPRSEARPLPIPRRLGRYQIVDRIASGGMAEVYLAVHGELAGLRTPVAVKRVLPQLAREPALIDMFLEEARIAAQLDHPNLVRIIEVGCDGDDYFQAMELVQGAPLWALVNASRRADPGDGGPVFDATLAAFVVAQAAAGLHHAHNLCDRAGRPLKLVHRDVSPQNILVSFEGSVKVIDFGIARSFGRISWTQTGTVRGKCAYMSPEQARGLQADLRADIFALGVVLWEAVTGRRLFERENPMATMHALVYEPIVPPSSLVPIGSELEAIIMQALARDRESRPASALELSRQLDDVVAEAGGVGARELSAVMKRLFAREHAAWGQTLREVMEAPLTDEARRWRFIVRARLTALAEAVRGKWRAHWGFVMGAMALAVVALGLAAIFEGTDRSSVPPPRPPAGPRLELLPAAIPELAAAPSPRPAVADQPPEADPSGDAEDEPELDRKDDREDHRKARSGGERVHPRKESKKSRSKTRSPSPPRKVDGSDRQPEVASQPEVMPPRADRRPNPFRD